MELMFLQAEADIFSVNPQCSSAADLYMCPERLSFPSQKRVNWEKVEENTLIPHFKAFRSPSL